MSNHLSKYYTTINNDMSEDKNELEDDKAVGSSEALAKKRLDEALTRVKESNQSLANKGEVTLTVRLSTEAEADELYRWLYADDKPMKSTLVGISWGCSIITNDKIDELIQSLESLKS